MQPVARRWGLFGGVADPRPLGAPIGAIAVATPPVRADAAKLAAAGALAAQAARDISNRLFGKAATAQRAKKP